jgi:hypothetical protein
MDQQPKVDVVELVELTTEELAEVGGGANDVPDPHVVNN